MSPLVRVMFSAVVVYLLLLLVGIAWAFWPSIAECAQGFCWGSCSSATDCSASCHCVGASPWDWGRCLSID